MPRAHGCARAADHLPYCSGPAPGPESLRLERLLLAHYRRCPPMRIVQPVQTEWLRKQGFHSALPCASPFGSEAVQISFPADLSLHAGVSTEAHQRDKLERLVPLRHPASGVGEALGNNLQRKYPLPA